MIYIFLAVSFPPLWLLFRLFRKKEWPRMFRIFLALLLLAATQSYVLDILMYGRLFWTEMPAWQHLLQSFALLFVFFLFICVFTYDCYTMVRKIFSRKTVDVGRRKCLQGVFANSILVGSPVVSGICAGKSVKNAIDIPEISERTLYHPKISKNLDGFTLCLLADIHIDGVKTVDWMQGVVAKTLARQPDLICCAGDLSDGSPKRKNADGHTREEICMVMSRLSAPYGVYACTGNHEYYSDYYGWMQVYEKAGIHVLHTTSVCLPVPGQTIELLGRDDMQHDTFSGFLSRPLSTQQDLHSFRILLDHRPGRVRENVPYADLQLSGHTHGGQCFFLENFVARANNGFVRGWYIVDNLALYVSNGTSLWSGCPVRIGVPAEITSITLKHAETPKISFL